MVTLLCVLFWTATSTTAEQSLLDRTIGAEQSLRVHDNALVRLAGELEAWLGGRQNQATTKKSVEVLGRELSRPLELPSEAKKKIAAAETVLLRGVNRFLSESQPDLEGQRRLFQEINSAIRDRQLAVLQWRVSVNRALIGASQSVKALHWFTWEASWLPLWKSEVDLTYSLQSAFLARRDTDDAELTRLVGGILRLQQQARLVGTPTELANLQQLAQGRLTLLARTAEQLMRLRRAGESRGAMTRIRRLSRDQAEISQKLQDARLAALRSLAL